MAIILNRPTVDRRKFAFGGDGVTLYADMSDLGWAAGHLNLHRIYDDAADIGVAIAAKDGIVIFYYVRNLTTADGEFLGIELRPIDEHVRKNATLKNITMQIVND